MTEQEFLDLSPRDRDAAVTEARGWRLGRREDDLGDVWLLADGGYPRGSIYHSLPQMYLPTTSIATAWELVEEMRAGNWAGEVTAGDGFSAAFFKWDVEESHEGYADTAALAISIAYLKVKGLITTKVI